jgi:hypothetical protein
MSKTEHERREMLSNLGLSPDAPNLAAQVTPTAPAKQKDGIRLAPEGTDPHAMPVTSIEFDPRLLDEFPHLEGEGMAAASRHIFGLYKSHGRNKDRNSLLHSEIGKFIARVRLERKTGGVVKERVKATREERDLAQTLATDGITAEDVAMAQLVRASGLSMESLLALAKGGGEG